MKNPDAAFRRLWRFLDVNKKSTLLAGVALSALSLIGLLGLSGCSRSDTSGAQKSVVSADSPTAAQGREKTVDAATEVSAKVDWCSEHRVPESQCTECHPNLIAEFKAKGDWCGGHNLPESHCRQCNPDLTFPQEPKDSVVALNSIGMIPASDVQNADWCVEHRVPESACTICNPDLIPAFKAKGDWCQEHGLPESVDRRCHPELTFVQEPKIETEPDENFRPTVFFPKNKTGCETDDAIIQFASAETAERAGLTVTPAIAVENASSVEAPAEVLFDETKSFVVTTTVPALVVRWLVEPGTTVSSGQAIAELESPDMPRLKADYLGTFADAHVAEQEFGRADSLFKRGLISAAEVQQVEGRFNSAQAHLAGALGLLEACGLLSGDIQFLQKDHKVTARWLLRASRSGALLERKAALGELLPAGSSLAEIGNPSVLWIEANVRESDISLFHKGQAVEFTTDGDALERVNGRIIWVAQYIDPQTRSAKVRAEVVNPPTSLKAHQFGRLALSTAYDKAVVAVPRDAVQWEGCCNVVFVKEASDRFRPHKVNVARGERGFYNITSGLDPGDVVVVKGSYLLKTELKKGSLGAGCCDVAPKS